MFIDIDPEIVVMGILIYNKNLEINYSLALQYLQMLEIQTGFMITPSFDEKSFNKLIKFIKANWKNNSLVTLLDLLDPRVNYPIEVLEAIDIIKLLNCNRSEDLCNTVE